MTPNVTFRTLESSKDRALVAQSGTSALEKWYNVVRDTPIVNFSCGDLCRACRQQIFPEAVLPVAIERLRKEPLAGEMYEGELLAAISTIPKDYWLTHPSEAKDVGRIAQAIIMQVDEELQKDLARLVVFASAD